MFIKSIATAFLSLTVAVAHLEDNNQLLRGLPTTALKEIQSAQHFKEIRHLDQTTMSVLIQATKIGGDAGNTAEFQLFLECDGEEESYHKNTKDNEEYHSPGITLFDVDLGGCESTSNWRLVLQEEEFGPNKQVIDKKGSGNANGSFNGSEATGTYEVSFR